jgi:hypothetical protein
MMQAAPAFTKTPPEEERAAIPLGGAGAEASSELAPKWRDCRRAQCCDRKARQHIRRLGASALRPIRHLALEGAVGGPIKHDLGVCVAATWNGTGWIDNIADGTAHSE